MARRMKTRAITLICAAALLIASTAPGAEQKQPSTIVKVADAVFVRPVSACSILAGSVVFVLALPVTAIRKEIKPAANELVTKPVHRTFNRPLGDMDAMAD